MKRAMSHCAAAALERGELASADSILPTVRTASPGLVTPEQ
jgi:hypothetical protein